MADSDIRKIADILQRNASYLAGVAARSLVPNLPAPWDGSKSVDTQVQATGLTGQESPPWGQDEVASMVQSGMMRFGKVLALSILVEEPGLLADDLKWLVDMFKPRAALMANRAWLDRLSQAYVAACEPLLDTGQLKVVTQTVECALERVGPATEPHT